MPLPGELDKTYASSLILAHLRYYVKIKKYRQNRKYIMYCTAINRGLSRGHRHNVLKQYSKTGTCGFPDMRVDRQTHKHADRNTSHPTGIKLKFVVFESHQ